MMPRSFSPRRSAGHVSGLLAAAAIALVAGSARAQGDAPATAASAAGAATEGELLSLLAPTAASASAAAAGERSMESDPFEAATDDERPAVPYVAVHLEIVNTLEVATVNLPLDGQVGPEDARRIAWLFRCRRTGRRVEMAPQVLAMLARVAAQWPDRPIQIVSGFRAPPFGAPQSKHFKGRAIDLRIRGVRTSRLRDFIWREHREVGVGFYARENFVHMDARPGEPDRAWSASEEGGPEEYNPRWARRARRAQPTSGTMVANAAGLVRIGQ